MLCYSATLCAYYFSVIKPLRLQSYNFFLICANKSLFFRVETIKSALKSGIFDKNPTKT